MQTPMPTQTLTLNVPDSLYEQLKQRAEQTQRTIEEEMLDVLAAGVSPNSGLPAEIAEVVESLSLASDAALWDAARERLPGSVSSELEMLHQKRQRSGLTDVESERLRELVRGYERHMLLRAQAAALLKQRGHDVSELTGR